MERHLRFIWSVIARQGLLLALIATIVILQAWWIYQRVRHTALDQAGRRQMVLAEQTARGIESYYGGIIETLDLVRRADDEAPPATAPARPPRDRASIHLPPAVEGQRVILRQLGRISDRGRVPLPPGISAGAARQILLPVFWDQLQDRVSQLFVVDQASMQVITGFPEGHDPDAAAIVDARRGWLAGVESPSVSKVGELGGQWGNIVAVPVPGRRLLCAVVPIEKVADHFLIGLADDRNGIAPMLLDESGRVLHSAVGLQAGRSLVADAGTPRLQQLVVETLTGTSPATHVLEGSQQFGDMSLSGVLVSVHPVEVPNGRWWLTIAASLTPVDAILRDMYRRVLVFAAIAIGLFTLVFVRIGIGQVRERTRLERVKHEMLAQEIAQARRIQLAWLPRAETKITGVEVAAVNRPANHISGDFYNWFDLPDGRSAVLIGDVTGHGMSAAFLMATTQLLARAALQRLGDPGRALTAVNQELCQQVFSGQFVTMVIVLLDLERAQMQVAAAGHPPAVIVRAGRVQPLDIDTHLVLGVERDWKYESTTVPLVAGDTLLLYTDGVIEAESEDGRRFDLAGLLDSLRDTRGAPADLLDRAQAAVDRFRGSKDLADDVTLVAVNVAAVGSEVPQAIGVL